MKQKQKTTSVALKGQFYGFGAGRFDTSLLAIIHIWNLYRFEFIRIHKQGETMKKTSLWIYIGLIITLAILAAINVFLPQGSFPLTPPQELPASKPVLALVNAAIMLILYGLSLIHI